VPTFSQNDWNISPPRFNLLRKLFNTRGSIFFLSISWSFKRTMPLGSEHTSGSNTLIMNKEMKRKLGNIINTGNGRESLNLNYALPKFLH